MRVFKIVLRKTFLKKYIFPKDDNLGIYVENARRERGRASEGGEGGMPAGICWRRSCASRLRHWSPRPRHWSPPWQSWSRPWRSLSRSCRHKSECLLHIKRCHVENWVGLGRWATGFPATRPSTCVRRRAVRYRFLSTSFREMVCKFNAAQTIIECTRSKRRYPRQFGISNEIFATLIRYPNCAASLGNNFSQKMNVSV